MGPLDDQNQKQNCFVEAVNAEKLLWKLIHFNGLLRTDAQELYRKARSSYEKIILDDHELAELQDIEYSLWKLHYKHIDEYRNKIRESSVNKECTNLAMLQNVDTVQHNSDDLLEGFKSFLSEATEFYQDLITKIRRSYGFPKELLFFDEGGFSSSMESKTMRGCQFSCHRCLVCLGDLARYRELYGNPDAQNRNWSVATTHYLNASMIWPDSGNPQNQLAVLATYVGDELLALYHCIRSLAVKEPFPDAWDNLILLFEKNRSSHLHSLSDDAAFNFLKPSERSIMQTKAQSSDSFSDCHLSEHSEDVLSEQTDIWLLVVQMISNFYIKPSSEFPCIFGSTVRELEALLSLDDARLKAALESYQHMDVARTGPFRVLQLVSILIFTIHTLSESPKLQNPKHMKYMQQPALIQEALASTFICMGRLVERCVVANPVDCSPLLPAILVFVEWLVDMLDTAETYVADEKCGNAMGYFFGAFVDLLNRFDDKRDEIGSPHCIALWEDNELRGFSPVALSHLPLDFSTPREPGNGFEDRHESQVRIGRILLAAMKAVNISNGSQKWILYEKLGRKFYTEESKKLPGGRESEAAEANLDFRVRELQQHFAVSKIVLPLCPTEESKVEVNECDQNNIDEHRNSTPVEEEEVILFKPLTRYNSAPLYIPVTTTDEVPIEGTWNQTAPSGECLRRGSSLDLQNQVRGDPSNFCSKITASSCNKTFWHMEPLLEDSVMDPFTEWTTDSSRFGTADTKTVALPFLAGPPSLSAWVLNKENLGIPGEKGTNDSSKYVSGHTEDIVSACLTGLSIGETAVSQQIVKVTSPTTASHFLYGSPSEGDSVIGPQYSSATIHYAVPPYLPPVPSAPLLPDDATWCGGDFPNYAECKNLEDMKENFLGASQVSSYLNLTGTQDRPNFDPSISRFSDGYTPLPCRADSAQWLHQYQDNLNLDRAHEHTWPIHFYTPTNPGRFHDNDVSRLSPFDRWTNPLASNPVKYLEGSPLHSGLSLVYGADEQKREKLFDGYQRPSPYGYGAAMDLRSEQQLLLQYLKEKERRLQCESQLRGPT